jgi:hypothetical protein
MFALTKEYTPLFNIERIDTIFGSSLAFDRRFLLPQVETVLFPGSALEIVRDAGPYVEVKTKEYPASIPLFVDKRCIRMVDHLQERFKDCPTKEKLLDRLLKFPKCHYVWGGTTPHGVPQWLHYYPPKKALTAFEFAHWTFRGVDCSGLLQHVTDGFTPRNTSDLYHFGYEVNEVKPFDLILYPGHVLIALPDEKVIECRHLSGIVISPLSDRLKESEHLGITFRRFL